MWLVARTQPQHEGVAQRQARRYGRTTYLPKFYDEDRQRRQCLFVGYLFIRATREWAFIHYCRAILWLLRNPGGDAAMLEDDFVRGLKARTVFGLVQLPARPILKRGDAVDVIYGPLEGCRGIYQGQEPHERISILLAFLGQTKLTLPARSVIAAPT